MKDKNQQRAVQQGTIRTQFSQISPRYPKTTEEQDCAPKSHLMKKIEAYEESIPNQKPGYRKNQVILNQVETLKGEMKEKKIKYKKI